MLQQNGPEEGGSLLLLKRLQTKLFRRISWSSGEEEFVEIKEEEEEGEGREGERVIRKKVDFVWGKGVDEII